MLLLRGEWGLINEVGGRGVKIDHGMQWPTMPRTQLFRIALVVILLVAKN